MPHDHLISASVRKKVREGKSSIDYHDEYERTLAEAVRFIKYLLEHVSERAETAAGIFCLHCKGTVKPQDYRGMVTDKITHKKNCLLEEARAVLAHVDGDKP